METQCYVRTVELKHSSVPQIFFFLICTWKVSSFHKDFRCNQDCWNLLLTAAIVIIFSPWSVMNSRILASCDWDYYMYSKGCYSMIPRRFNLLSDCRSSGRRSIDLIFICISANVASSLFLCMWLSCSLTFCFFSLTALSYFAHIPHILTTEIFSLGILWTDDFSPWR